MVRSVALDYLGGKKEKMAKHVPAKTAPHPTQAQRPADDGVPPQRPPGQHEVGREDSPGGEGGEEDQGGGGEVVEELEGEDLGEEAEGGEARLGVGRGCGAAWHFGRGFVLEEGVWRGEGGGMSRMSRMWRKGKVSC